MNIDCARSHGWVERLWLQEGMHYECIMGSFEAKDCCLSNRFREGQRIMLCNVCLASVSPILAMDLVVALRELCNADLHHLPCD